MKNNFRNKKAYFVFLFAFSPQLFYKPYEGKKCTTTALPPNLYNCETVTPGTKQMLQSTQRPTEWRLFFPLCNREQPKNLPQPHSYMEDRNSSRASSLWLLAGQHDSPRVTGLWVWDVPESGNPVPAPCDGSLGWWHSPLLGSWNGPATCSAYRCFYSGQDLLIPGRCQLQVLGSLPNLWSYLKSLSFLQKWMFGQFISHVLVNRDTWGPHPASRLIVSGWYVPHGSPTHYHHNCFLLPWKWCFDTREGDRTTRCWRWDSTIIARKGRLLSKAATGEHLGLPLGVRKFETYIYKCALHCKPFLHNAWDLI